MPSVRKYDLLQLADGYNDTAPPTHIADSELQAGQNVYPWEQKPKRRPGIAQVTTVAYSEDITALFPYSRTGGWDLYVGVQSGFAKRDGNTLTAITNSGDAIASSSELWCFRQRNEVIYASRKSTGTLRRVTDVARNAGLAAPATACVIADGGAGVMSASDYTVTVTYAHIDSEGTIIAESNESPASNTLAQGGNKQIAVSSIPVPSDPYVNARCLYINVPGQSGRRFLMRPLSGDVSPAVTIPDATTTTFAFNDTQDETGKAASTSNGIPPAQVRWHDFFGDRLWVTDGKYVYPSEQGLPESYNLANAIAVNAGDGHDITVVKTFGHGTNQRLAVGKTNLVDSITGFDRSSFGRSMIDEEHGCPAPESMQTGGNLLFWYTGKDVMASDGSNSAPISDTKVRTLLDRIPESRKPFVVATIDPGRHWYLLSFSVDDATENNMGIAYNYRRQKWSAPFVWTAGGTKGPAVFGNFYGESGEKLLYAAFYDSLVYDINDDDQETDAGTAITCKLRTKDFGFEQQNEKKGMHRVGLLSASVPASVTARLYLDGSDTHYKERTVSLDQTAEWKRLNLSSMKKLAKTISLELEYSGAHAPDFAGLTFELVGFERGGQPL